MSARRIAGLEEHLVVTPDVPGAWRGLDPRWQDLPPKPPGGESGRCLAELRGDRPAAMDEGGLDVRVLSLAVGELDVIGERQPPVRPR